MMNKKDWLEKGTAMHKKNSNLKFLEKMLKKFQDAEKMINDKIEDEKKNDGENSCDLKKDE